MSYSNENIVEVRHVSKAYKLFNSPGQRFCYQLLKKGNGKDFYALKDVSFDVKRGESFAIIGKNGSGKSTMLQILAGILKPTTGSVNINGRVAALLELGSGFNPESTGYENIFMNAAILGVDHKKIESKVQEIVDFADIGDFINQPVKTYSSGMYIRLAFAVAINVDADIILVDEALAVGDVFFRQKCYTKLNELRSKGATIILVTHNMSEVEQFCDRALLLYHGAVKFDGRSSDAVKLYYMLNQEDQNPSCASVDLAADGDQMENKTEDKEGTQIEFSDGWKIKEQQFYDLNNSMETANGKARFIRVGLFDREGNPRRSFIQGEEAYFYLEAEAMADLGIPLYGLMIYNQFNIVVHGRDMTEVEMVLPQKVRKGQKIKGLIKIRLDIAEGEYTFETGISSMNLEEFEKRKFYSQEELDAHSERLCSRNNVGEFTVTLNNIGTPTKMKFHGACNLPGSMELILE